MFLIKAAFWLALVLAFLPVERSGEENRLKVSVGSALLAAQATYNDLAGFCDRNPSTCETGREVATTFGARAETGARAVIDLVRSNATDGVNNYPEGLEPRPVETHAVQTETLTSSDKEPNWVDPGQG